MITTKSFLKSIINYGFNNALITIIGFIFLPVFAKHFTTYEFGIWGLFQSLSPLIITFTQLNTPAAIVTFFYDTAIDRKIYISNCIQIYLVTFFIVILLCLVFLQPISNIISWPIYATILLLISAFLSGFNNFIITIIQIDNQSKYYFYFSSLKILITNFLLLLMILFYHQKWDVIFYSTIIVEIIYFVASVTVLKKKYNVAVFAKSLYIKEIIRFSVPLLPSSLNDWIIRSSNRVFLSNMVSVNESGLLSIGYKFGNLTQNINQAINRAFGAYFFSNIDDAMINKNKQTRLIQVIYLSTIILIIVSVMLFLFSNILVNLFVGREFNGAAKYIFFISISFVEISFFEKLYNFLLKRKKTFLISIITVFCGILNFVLNYYLIKNYGSLGSIFSVNITYFIGILITWYYVNKYFPFNWFKNNVFKIK